MIRFEDLIKRFWSEYEVELKMRGVNKGDLEDIIMSYFDMIRTEFNADGLPDIRLPHVSRLTINVKGMIRDLKKCDKILEQEKAGFEFYRKQLDNVRRNIKAYIIWYQRNGHKLKSDYYKKVLGKFYDKYEWMLYD